MRNTRLLMLRFLIVYAVCQIHSVYSVLVPTAKPFKGGDSTQWSLEASTVCPNLCKAEDSSGRKRWWDTNFSCKSRGVFNPLGTFNVRAVKCFCSCTDIREPGAFETEEDPMKRQYDAQKKCPDYCASLSTRAREMVWNTTYTCVRKSTELFDPTGRNKNPPTTCTCGCTPQEAFARAFDMTLGTG